MRYLTPALGLLLLLAACGSGSSTTSAEAAPDQADASTTLTAGQGNGPGNGPPQAAIDACAGLTDGATCSFTSRRGETVTGSCFSINGNTACKPDNAPMGGGRGQGLSHRR